MSYLYLVLAFCAAVFGIIGDTWDQDAKGLMKFTRKGCIVLIIAISMLCLSSWDVYNNQVNQSKIDSYIKDQIAISLFYITYDLILARKAVELAEKFGHEKAINMAPEFPYSNKLCSSDLEKLLDESFISFLKTVKYENIGFGLITTKLGFDILEKTLIRHDALLSPEQHVLIGEILNNGYISDKIHKIKSIDENKTNTSIKNLHYLDKDLIKNYKIFVNTSNSLLHSIGYKDREGAGCII